MKEFFVVEPCSSSGGFEIKLKDKRIDLKKAEKALAGIGELMASMPVVLVAKVGSRSISIYASGRMMVKGGKKLTAAAAKKLALRLVGVLESGEAIV